MFKENRANFFKILKIFKSFITEFPRHELSNTFSKIFLISLVVSCLRSFSSSSCSLESELKKIRLRYVVHQFDLSMSNL